MLEGNDLPVAIVGGGIAGLATARAMDARGLPFVVFERREDSAAGGLALNLPGNAIQALSSLGLRERIEAIGRPLRRREYRNSRDRLLFAVDEDGFWGAASRPRSVRRSELLRMLREGLPDEALRHGAAVVSVGTLPGAVALELEDGARFEARLAVGADGVHSTVRSHVFGSVGQPASARLAEASWRFMAPNPGIDCWTVWAGAEGMVLLMPVDRGEVYGWAALTRTAQAGGPGALEQLVSTFPRRAKQAVLHALSQPGALHHSPIEEVRLGNWHEGRMVLVGDAAHATAPVWAEGAPLAMEDGIVLARALATCADVPMALQIFEGQRRRRVAHVQASTDAMSKAAKLPPLLRDALLPLVGAKRYRRTYEPLKQGI